MFDAEAGKGVEEGDALSHVAAPVQAGFDDRFSHGDQTCEVDAGIHSVIGDNSFNGGAVADGGLVEGDVLIDGHAAAAAQVVDDNHRLPCCSQLIGHDAADETGPSGYEHGHIEFSSIWTLVPSDALHT